MRQVGLHGFFQHPSTFQAMLLELCGNVSSKLNKIQIKEGDANLNTTNNRYLIGINEVVILR